MLLRDFKFKKNKISIALEFSVSNRGFAFGAWPSSNMSIISRISDY